MTQWSPEGFSVAKYNVSQAHEFKSTKFVVRKDCEYSKMLELLSENYFGADCTAFVIKTDKGIEEIWNYFSEETTTFVELINQDMRRKNVIKDAHCIFVHFLRRKLPVQFNIYMMGGHKVDGCNYCLLIIHGSYDPIEDCFNYTFSSNVQTHLN